VLRYISTNITSVDVPIIRKNLEYLIGPLLLGSNVDETPFQRWRVPECPEFRGFGETGPPEQGRITGI
jgi:hypothetical protein